MDNLCSKCLAPLAPKATGCSICAARRAEFENNLQIIIQLIDSNQDEEALGRLNLVVDTAPAERLPECYAIRGYAHLKQSNFERADEDCTESIALDWEQAQAYEWRAAARSRLNQWDLVFDDLDRAYEHGGAMQDRYLGLMEVMSRHGFKYFQDLSNTNQLNADRLRERGWMSLRMNRFDKAQADFDQALKLQPGHSWASLGLAKLILRTEGLQVKRHVFQLCDDALAGDPDCRWLAQTVLARLHSKFGDNYQAKKVLQDLARHSADNSLKLASCAQLMMNVGDHVSAIDIWNQILERNKELALGLRKRGDCFAAICNYSLALQDYSAYLERFPDSIKALVLRSKMWVAIQRFGDAVRDLKRALELEPSNYEANLCFGQVNGELGRLDLALHHSRLAVQIDGRQAEAFSALAAVYNRLSEYRQAIEEYTRSIELSRNIPERAQNRFLRGIAAYENQEFDFALADFKQATEERPLHAGSWIWRAAACSRLEDWPGAIMALQKAIQVRPAVAEQYQTMGRPIAEKAIEFYRRAEQRQRDHSPVALLMNRGLAHQFLEQHELAIADFTTGLNHMPKDQELTILRGKSASQLGQDEAANADFSQAIARAPDDHRPYYYRALVRVRLGNLPAARQDMLRAIQLAPNEPRYLLTLGELSLKSGDRKTALEYFDRAILLDPTNPISYRARGLTHWTQRDQPSERLAAIRDFTHSLVLQPAQPDLLVHRGQAHLKSNQPISALEDFETALTLNDRQANAYSGRAEILVTQQKHEYALIWLTKAIHRFSEPGDLAEIIFARGRVFLEMARYVPANGDFTEVMKIIVDDPKIVAAARFARAVAKIHNQQFDSARRDLKKLTALDPHDDRVKQALAWLDDRSLPVPKFLQPPVGIVRPTRPAAMRSGVVLGNGTITQWTNQPPHDLWIVRTEDKKEFGPVSLTLLAEWASQGRLVNGMKLLRADWSKWKRIEKIFPEITPLESLKGLIEEFPRLELNKKKKNGS
jgi:tetratricopeptide (TPR) repeat protein